MTTPITRLAPTPRPTGRHAAAAGSGPQHEFARLSRRVEQAQRRLQAWRDVPDALAARVESALAPAMADQRDAEHGLVIQLDALLVSPPKGLRLGTQRRAALASYLLDLCRDLLAHGHDDTLLAIHDRHSRRSHAALTESARAHGMDQALAMLDATFGEGAVRPLPGESDEAFYARAEQRLFEAYDAERAREDAARAQRAQRRAARKAARHAAKAGASGKRSKRGARADASDAAQPPPATADARASSAGQASGHAASAAESGLQTTPGPAPSPEDRLRSLYRRLASALHPDRAPEGEARTRRTVQMKALNAAWDARDLLAMLALQAEALRGEQAADALPDAQARDYIALLEAQLERLKTEARRAADAATPPDIAIAHGRPREPAQLMQWLEMDLQRVRRNTTILRDIAAGLADPGQRRDAVDTLVERAETELMRRALDEFIEDLARPA